MPHFVSIFIFCLIIYVGWRCWFEVSFPSQIMLSRSLFFSDQIANRLFKLWWLSTRRWSPSRRSDWMGQGLLECDLLAGTMTIYFCYSGNFGENVLLYSGGFLISCECSIWRWVHSRIWNAHGTRTALKSSIRNKINGHCSMVWGCWNNS